jgi:hypothetical protein
METQGLMQVLSWWSVAIVVNESQEPSSPKNEWTNTGYRSKMRKDRELNMKGEVL